jgi:hypothetical protein
MRKMTLAIACLLALVTVQAGFASKKPSSNLVEAAEAIQKLDANDFTAIKNWMKGEGRSALRERGLTDKEIGGLRLDTDKFGDAPFGS